MTRRVEGLASGFNKTLGRSMGDFCHHVTHHSLRRFSATKPALEAALMV